MISQPKEIGEITQQTAPQLSRFFFKIANDQVVWLISLRFKLPIDTTFHTRIILYSYVKFSVYTGKGNVKK